MSNSPLGSLWHRWDLHFHTPSSFDYDDKSVTNAQIVDSLVAANIRVVAITDHHLIDIERIKSLRDLARDEVTILPGIELRSELGDKPIHYIGIFPEMSDLAHLWDSIKGALGLTPQGVREKGGDEKVWVPIKDAHELFTNLHGVISIHAGAKSNSIDSIRNQDQFQQRLKLDVSRRYVDILEIGQIKDVSRYRDIIFPATGLDLPLIVGSDNHNANDYSMPVSCWLKADPTFTGLRQILNEPAERVYTGKQPPVLDRVENNATRYIHSIDISKKVTSQLEEQWFDGVSLNLNPGLVAVIGNKGSGKSALTDILGLLGNSPHEDTFSFLHPEQFRHPRERKAREFDARLVWRSGDPVRRNLADSVPDSSVEAIKYIPQKHLEAICDELKGGREGRFEKELKNVIFSRVPAAERMDHETLDELIDFTTAELQEAIHILREEVTEANATVVDLENKASPGYREALQAKLAELDQELAAHEAARPEVVPKPAADPDRTKEIDRLNLAIEKLADKIEDLDGSIQLMQKAAATATRRLSLVEKIRRSLTNLRQEFAGAVEKISGECKELEIQPSDLVTLEVDTTRLEEIETQAEAAKREAEADLDEDRQESTVARRNSAKAEIIELREELDRPNREYQEYLEKEAVWKRQKDALIGDVGTAATIEHLRARIRELKSVPGQLVDAREQQISASLQIFGQKLELVSEYEQLYAPVQDFIDTHPLARDRFGLQFRVSMMTRHFPERFLDYINQSRKGSFRGEREGRRLVEQLLEEADFNSAEGLRAFLTRLGDYLRHDRRGDEGEEVSVDSQLRDAQGFSPIDLYEYVFGLEYLQPRFVLRWDNRPLEQLSPGERGTLLLIFFLLIDDSKMPLVIDQPEGNLDNQTVYELLVDCVREAKCNRQIIIVTHNPNLAVVCDAEQVIYASLDKDVGNRVHYTSGALENPEICKYIVDVLEGTMPAIDKRISKYKVIFDAQLG